MFERLYIHNYKCFVNFELHLSETTLLAGTNGSGKTAVLDVLFGLRKLLAGEAKITDRIAFHPSTVPRWLDDVEQLFEMDVRAEGEQFRYRLKVEHNPDGKSRVSEESLISNGEILFRCDLGAVQLYRDDGSEGPKYHADWSESALARVVPQPANTRLTRFMEMVQATIVCSIRPFLLRAESEREAESLDRHGENFADWYRHAVQANPVSVSSHIEALRPVIAGFDGVHLPTAGLDRRALLLDFDYNGNTLDGSNSQRFKLRFDELSDGQRALVVLYALLRLREPERGVVLFLDEPDNFLALAEIQPWLLAVVELCEETPSQVVICSHHPELIDYLGPDDGLLLRREASAITVSPLKSIDLTDSGLKLSEQLARGWDT